ncbi:MAG: hypothetical protein RJB62_1228 [Pseudomonadota bacterium]|jgi:hypothetical protein
MKTETMARAFPAFAVGFTIYYAIAFEYNCCYLPAFTYYPAINEFVPFFATGNDEIGPPMHWYGWMVNAALAGAALAVISLLLPAKATEKAWGVLAWAVPLVGMGAMVYFDRLFFI